MKKEKDNTMPTKINLKMQHGLDFILNFLTEKFKEDEREEFCKYVYNNLTFLFQSYQEIMVNLLRSLISILRL